MRIHEIILESTQSADDPKMLIDILKKTYESQKELLALINDHNKSVANEGIGDKLKKAALAGALGLAALSPAAQGQTTLHDLYNKPYTSPFVAKDTLTIISSCAADLTIMANHIRRTNSSLSGNAPIQAGAFARKASDIMALMKDYARETGKTDLIPKMEKAYKDQYEKNSYLNQLSWRHIWPDELSQHVEANMQECLKQIEKLQKQIETSKSQPKAQPKAQSQPASKLSPEELRAQFKADAMRK